MTQPFHMFELNRKLVEEIRTHLAHPHRHEYEEILIITKGKPHHFIDFEEVTVAAPVVIYVAQGKVHEFMPDPETRGWCIRYRNDFIPESNFHFFSNYLDRISFAFDQGVCRQEIGILCELILSEYQRNPEKTNVYRYLFQALLAKLDSEGSHHIPHEQDNNNPQQIAFRSFLAILEQNYMRDVNVTFYADKLNTSIRNLNHLCSKVFGKSVSEIIETRKMIEARRLLLAGAMTVSEIGYSLGYNEKSYFTRAFKKRTGMTPTHFRESVRAKG